MKTRDKITVKEIRNFCDGQFFSDKDTPWQPFEDYPVEQVREFQNELANNLIQFLKVKGE